MDEGGSLRNTGGGGGPIRWGPLKGARGMLFKVDPTVRSPSVRGS